MASGFRSLMRANCSDRVGIAALEDLCGKNLDTAFGEGFPPYLIAVPGDEFDAINDGRLPVDSQVLRESP